MNKIHCLLEIIYHKLSLYCRKIVFVFDCKSNYYSLKRRDMYKRILAEEKQNE